MSKNADKWAKLHAKAYAAGMAALEACLPTPMVVQQHANALNDASPVVKEWYVPEGVCGFGWVVVTPGTCSFAAWLRKTKDSDGQPLGSKHYYGGTCFWVHEGDQSYDRKMAFARAYAGVLNAAGVRAHAGGRLD